MTTSPDGPDRSPRKRGRPRGSVSLTSDRLATIVGLLRNGATPDDAAESAGVPARTMREWRARGAGRSKRGATEELRGFERACRQAEAEAKASAKARVHQRNPERWLDRKGYREDDGAAPTPTTEEVRELAVAFIREALSLDPTVTLPRCLSPRCRCSWHRERTTDELEKTRAMASNKGRRRSA
ncbi:MAG: hypothetical protein M3P11_13000 [Actinomycetota bacterium]|nr:hypothetical protein [Actinomycetota bacterium]